MPHIDGLKYVHLPVTLTIDYVSYGHMAFETNCHLHRHQMGTLCIFSDCKKHICLAEAAVLSDFLFVGDTVVGLYFLLNTNRNP